MRTTLTMKEVVVLVVIGAVSMVVLLSVAMDRPPFTSSPHGHPDVECKANLHHVGLALASYRAENDGSMRLWPDMNGDGVPEYGFTVGGDTGVHDSSLLLADLYAGGHLSNIPVFLCPAADIDAQSVEVTEQRADGSPINGTKTGLWFRFAPGVSDDCDPCYMVDPHVPKNPAPERIILACGPDLGHLRTTASVEVAKESSYHGRGTLVLFADQSVQYLTMDAMGRITNTRFANTAYADPDIYFDDDVDGDGDYLNDDKWDANLGNWWVDYEAETPIARYHKGPGWDRRE